MSTIYMIYLQMLQATQFLNKKKEKNLYTKIYGFILLMFLLFVHII
jgi:hypothetical protein